jgi:fructokinase
MPLRIGIDLGGTKIEAIALDGSRELLRCRVPTPRNDYTETIQTVVDLVNTIERQTAAIGTVGIGIPGTLAADTGLVKNANSVWLIGQPLLRDFELRLGRPVRIANDANCFAMSEAMDGAGRGAAVVFGVIVGTGTGGGIVVNGQLLNGADGIAGEWGHNPLPWPDAGEWPGPPCYCGKTGCIETFLSGSGMAREYERASGARADPPEIVRLAALGDADAQRAIGRYEDRMARALASVVNVLDPDVIVLGGGMSNLDGLYERVPALWGKYVFAAVASAAGPVRGRQPSAAKRRLVRAAHGDSSGVRGAAWLWPE